MTTLVAAPGGDAAETYLGIPLLVMPDPPARAVLNADELTMLLAGDDVPVEPEVALTDREVLWREWRVAWMEGEVSALEADLKKIADLDKDSEGTLWELVFAKVAELFSEFDIHDPDPLRFKQAVMSIQSAIGNSSERMFAILGDKLMELLGGTFDKDSHLKMVAFLTDTEFAAMRVRLKKEIKKGLSLDLAAKELATAFYITEAYAKKVLTTTTKRQYPDTVAVFEDCRTGNLDIRIAEHKLSGDNDSKSVVQNNQVLEDMRRHFDVKGREVTTVLALPFSAEDGSMVRRWANDAGHADKPVANGDVWEQLYGAAITMGEYRAQREALATYGAYRFVQFFIAATKHVVIVDGEWAFVDYVAKGKDSDSELAVQGEFPGLVPDVLA